MSTIKTAFAMTWLPNPDAQVDYREALSELTQIRDVTRASHSDFLSVRIWRWATCVIQDARANGNINPDDAHIARAIHARIDQLVLDILVNPLSFNPATKRNNLLKDPLSVRDWVWEKRDYEVCETLFPLSPLDDEDMPADPPPHIPAKRMLAWVARLQGEVPLTPASGEPTTSMTTVSLDPGSMQMLPRNPMIDQMRRMIYMKLCAAARSQRRDQIFRQNMEDTASWADQRMTVIHALSSQVIANAQQESRVAEQTIRSGLEEVARVHQETFHGLQHHLSEQNTAHQAEEAALEEQLALRDQTHTATIHLLDAQIVGADEAQGAATSDLQEHIHALTLSHNTQVSNLEGHLDRSSQQHATDVTHIRETEAGADALANDLIQTRAQLQAASQSLATQQAQTVQSTAQVQQLQNQVNAAMRSAYGY